MRAKEVATMGANVTVAKTIDSRSILWSTFNYREWLDRVFTHFSRIICAYVCINLYRR
jgi:hypothetical protein